MGVGSIMDGGSVGAGGPVVGWVVCRCFWLSVYIKRIRNVSYYFFQIKNISKLINQQFKNGVKSKLKKES